MHFLLSHGWVVEKGCNHLHIENLQTLPAGDLGKWCCESHRWLLPLRSCLNLIFTLVNYNTLAIVDLNGLVEVLDLTDLVVEPVKSYQLLLGSVVVQVHLLQGVKPCALIHVKVLYEVVTLIGHHFVGIEIFLLFHEVHFINIVQLNLHRLVL